MSTRMKSSVKEEKKKKEEVVRLWWGEKGGNIFPLRKRISLLTKKTDATQSERSGRRGIADSEKKKKKRKPLI